MGIGVGGMEKIGVEAIVDGLNSFLGDMKKMDKSIADVNKPVGALGKMFSGLGNIISGLVSGVFRVLEFTLGNLLASAIQSVVGQLKELISTAIEGTTEFQKLEVRLNRLNLNDLTKDEIELGLGIEYATKQTQEQLKWTIKLGANTPFDSKDIANVYTLARTYGFANQEAQDLTVQITSFASGMGLSNEHIERIVQNFGQMKAAGKITGTEIRDLARGAFVPVNDILDSVAENLGITTDQLAVLRKKGLTDAEMFFAAFGQMVDHDFRGAAEDMNAVLAVSIANIKEMARSFLGFNIIKPIFEGLATIVVSFQKELSERFDEFWDISERIGKTLNEIITDITGGLPSVSSLADGLVKGLDRVADWLDTHKEDIVSWVQDAIAELGKLRDFLFGTSTEKTPSDKRPHGEGNQTKGIEEQGTDGALQKILDIVIALTPLIQPLTSLLASLGSVILAAFGVESTTTTQTFSEFVTNTMVPAIEKLTKFLNENKESIAQWIKVLATIFIIVTVAGWVLGFIVKLVTLISVIWKVVTVVGALVSGLGPLIAIIAAVAIGFLFWKFIFTLIAANAKSFIDLIKKYFNDVKNNILTTLQNIITAAKNKDWKGIGKAIVDGIVGYVKTNIDLLAGIITTAIQNAIDAAKATLDSDSPSKVFEEIAAGTMEGFAIGVKKNTDLAVRAMQKAVGQVAMPAFGAPAMAFAGAMAPASSMNSTVNYNNTLNVHTNARSEPIISDFNMLQSLSG